ncbi:MAG TPA: peptidoglycan DD-metalloendopeptidase family protein [Candidatus Binataceae bacterium]|nr:peptidoglycan DD-metalloendopeptidase family protein [Candidatus Binataceae bacterium]
MASVRLFIEAPPDTDDQDTAAVQDVDVAGRLESPSVDLPAMVAPAPEPITVALTLDRSASIVSYLTEAGLGSAEAQRWGMLLERTAAIRNFVQGHSLTLYKDPETSGLRGLKYNLDDRVAVKEVTYGDGVNRVTQEPILYVVRPVAVSFRLRSDFWREARRNDLPQPIVATLDYAFKDRRPLSTLPRGSDIKLIYQEKVSRDGTTSYATGLQAAEISFGGKTLTAMAFRDETGQPRLYDANGKALGAQALRYPLNFQYISSGFSFARYHPILHEYRPHVGVDLVAQYGTPVKAVADGRVETAGWCGELGRCVRIRHAGEIVSIYGHLSQIPPEIQPGADVRLGQVIGRVGTSGLSTGPHLHYALEEDGRYVNPLTATIGENHQVSPRMRALFDHFKEHYLAAFSRLPDFGRPPTVSPAGSAVAAEPSPSVMAIADTQAKTHVRHSQRMRVERTVETTSENTPETTEIDGRESIMR